MRIVLFSSFCAFCLNMFSQQEAKFQTKGIIIPSGTISPGFMTSQQATNIYLHGGLEYYLENKVSFKGDVFWHVGSQEKTDFMKVNHSLYYGLNFHNQWNRLDLYFGIQPGLFYSQPNMMKIDSSGLINAKLNPSASVSVGMTYFVARNFNFFLNGRYVYGNYYAANDRNISLNEFRISAGLSFNFRLFKRKEIQ